MVSQILPGRPAHAQLSVRGEHGRCQRRRLRSRGKRMAGRIRVQAPQETGPRDTRGHRTG